MSRFEIVVAHAGRPAIVVHGGAGAYLKTTTAAQRRRRGEQLGAIASAGHRCFADGGALAATLTAIRALEDDPSFNAGYGSRLQQDGMARLSAALMDGRSTRMAAVYNVQDCRHPSELCAALLGRPDRHLDGCGARLLMRDIAMAPSDVRTPEAIERWRALVASTDGADREGAIGCAGARELALARAARITVPAEIDALCPEDRHGTVGVVACGRDGDLWACTSTGGRGHEPVGRISDSPTPAGTYACPLVALSATGFGEQILDLNLCGRVATRVLDGATLEQALARCFEEVADAGGLCGVIAVTADGTIGYAHTTEACGVAWADGSGRVELDKHGR